MSSPGKPSKKKKPAAHPASAAVAGGPFGILPDDLIRHVLSFLPAQEAVRTCVLARRWRCLWEGATGLRIVTAASAPNRPLALLSRELRDFVDHLFLLRGHAPLHTCEFMFRLRSDADVRHVHIWIRYAIRCRIRTLRLSLRQTRCHSYSNWEDSRYYVDNLPLISRHLTRLELTDTGLSASFLDFSGCPSLEDLVIHRCSFVRAKRISSKSVKHLTLVDPHFNHHPRTSIDVPSIVSLRLEYPDRTPTLGSMPLLAEAFVRLGKVTLDFFNLHGPCQGCVALEAYYYNDTTGNNTNKNRSLLLQGLSEAKSLVLIDEFPTYIFEQDMKWCPTFRNLKTLSLGRNWCVPPDFCALTCILSHSPVLEKLTLYMHSSMVSELKVEIRGSYTPIEGSAAVSENLRVVQVKCEVVDERVMEILNFLGTLNIDFNYEKNKEDLPDGSAAS